MIRAAVLVLVVTIAGFAFPHDLNPHGAATPEFAKCTGSTPCRACKNCKYCKHCNEGGGTCGVCKRK